ncbi:hypothetical protein CDD81_146 [Ophiocordyceps australis]|uniref:Uncharacterized protein n=1 Tax=Ophiocordyceps australis TaxID=1399860 RepID=A0A2C5YF68_9HYPO|nr:hypothetical protein CDD81_146 [Ophiocordyceps australis]
MDEQTGTPQQHQDLVQGTHVTLATLCIKAREYHRDGACRAAAKQITDALEASGPSQPDPYRHVRSELFGICSEFQPAASIRGCSLLDQITVWMKLGSGFYDGTWSRILYSFSSSQGAVRAANAPHAGDCIKTSVPLMHAFGQEPLQAARLAWLSILDVTNQDVLSELFGADEWKFEGFRIDARCLDSNTTLVFNRRGNQDTLFHHDRLHYDKPTVVQWISLRPMDWVPFSRHEPEPFCHVDAANYKTR